MTFNTEHEATLMIHTSPPPPAKITQSPLFLASSPLPPLPPSRCHSRPEKHVLSAGPASHRQDQKNTIVSKLNADRQPGFSVVISGGNL